MSKSNEYRGYRVISESENDFLVGLAKALKQEGFEVSQGIDQLVAKIDGVTVGIGHLTGGHSQRPLTVTTNRGSFSQYSLKSNLTPESVSSKVRELTMMAGGVMPLKPFQESEEAAPAPKAEDEPAPKPEAEKTIDRKEADEAEFDRIQEMIRENVKEGGEFLFEGAGGHLSWKDVRVLKEVHDVAERQGFIAELEEPFSVKITFRKMTEAEENGKRD